MIILLGMNKPRRKTLGVTLAMGGATEPSELGLVGEEVTFNLFDGSASPGWIIQGDRADGPAAVVVHGHRDSRYGSLYRAEMLKSYCYKIAVFDLPAHGDAEAGRCLMAAREADDVRAVVEGLPEEMTRGRPLVILGYSMGATIVVKAAAKYPELFSPASADADKASESGAEPSGGGVETSGASGVSGGGGVIVCAPYRWWDEGLRGQMERRGLPRWPLVGCVGLVLHIASRLRLPGRGGLGERPGFDRAEDAKAIEVPMLVLHGDADTICPLSAGRAIAEAAPQGELTVIAGGTHNQLLGADYEAVHGALRKFFDRVG
ncbi:MAG: alpha/beta hydrolase [Planctomycetota bacterium]